MFITLGLLITLVILVIPKCRANLLYFLPPLNAIADAVTLGEESADAGLMRVPVMIAAVVIYSPRIKIDATNSLIALFLSYLAALVPFSSDPLASFQIYCKVFLCIAMLPVANYVVTNARELAKLCTSIVIAAAVCLINFLFAQLFELGRQPYGENAFYVAGGGVYITYVLTYALILGPMTLHYSSRPQRLLLGVLYALSAIVVLVTFRRGSILALAAGYSVLIPFGRLRHNKTILTVAVIAGLFLILLAPMYSERILGLYESRIAEGAAREFEGGEGRVQESEAVWSELFGKSLKHTLVGTELFNSVSYFHSWRSGTGRGLHMDINIILHGSGLIGLCFYLAILTQLAIHFLTCLSHRESVRMEVILYRSTALAVLVAGFVLSLSTQLWAVTSYLSFWMLLGALHRLTSRGSESLTLIHNTGVADESVVPR